MAGFRSRSESARRGNPRPNTARQSIAHNRGRMNGAKHPTGGARAGAAAGAGDAAAHQQAGGNTAAPAAGHGRSAGYQQRRPEHRQESPRQAGTGDRARDAAFAVLREVSVNDAYGNIALPAILRERKIKGRDAAFATEITYGCLRATGLLDAIITAAAGRPVEKIDSVALDALRLGTYQLLRTRVGEHAAVDTSVELTKANGARKAAGFVNGVLRTIARQDAAAWVQRVAGGDTLADVALRHAHPEWIAEVFQRSLSQEDPAASHELSAALAADDQRPAVHLVARPGQITAEELALITGGEEGTFSPYAVYLEAGDPGQLDPVREGLAAVQDEGSQLIGLALTNAPLKRTDRGRWLDLCAGPGGKTGFVGSWAIGSQATVDAVELAPHRAQLVSQSTAGLPVTVHTGDGRALRSISTLALPEAGYDRVLVDAPCTGLGALRRRPEARWRKSSSDVAPLVTLQKDLLRSALRHTAPGGVVVYSTCSPHPAETRDVVFSIAAETGAEIVDATETLSGATLPGSGLKDTLGSAPFVQLWPHRHGTDAMFIAMLRTPAASSETES